MKRLAKIIGSACGCGYFPIAPGTAGSLVAIVALWLLPPVSLFTLTVTGFLFFGAGVWASTICEREWGHDAGRIVWDEVLGMMISIAALPKKWVIYVAAFFLFRLFDIVKPFPANVSQRLPKGWGVMVDDVIAALYTNIVLQIVFKCFFEF
ncbi:phosphatidylglycerophosphatase A [candidate division KSB1 bacterium]|nr:phosphatidylglycerophosphatase A [candidate division KSB1 bacterium]